jgi:hypothetical protein
MVIRRCQECGGNVSSLAESCPHCGYRLQRTKRRILWSVSSLLSGFIIIVGLLMGWLMVRGIEHQGGVSYVLPDCNSPSIKQLAKTAVENAPYSQIIKLTLFDLEDVHQTNYDEMIPKRFCAGRGYFNSGIQPITFTLEFAGEDQSKVWLQILPQ